MARSPAQNAFRAAFNRALASGHLIRASACEWCGGKSPRALHGHHEDYSKPLKVIWLCNPCHTMRHRGLPHLSTAQWMAIAPVKLSGPLPSRLRDPHKLATARKNVPFIEIASYCASRPDGVALNDIVRQFGVAWRTAQRMVRRLERQFPQTRLVFGKGSTRRWYLDDARLVAANDAAQPSEAAA